ncbi:RidA family protein [Blastococcus sp. CT_GayMR20]|uniref:RidA family protein n=1 Tax=Blastococcus sp. CT_GayMR20 TaxID=2559609 RepID=UPI001073EC13|nr:Rid family detoxifying hydrolase [Blastococcus sp. CT_GayMR20]TFV81175.1 RidA family protein [Blastococcus sp. CT_GayMR20]
MSAKQGFSTADAPQPVGAFSQAVRAGDFIFVAGQGPIDPATGAVVGATIGEQTVKTLQNLATILSAAGASLDDVVKVTAHLADLDHFRAYDDAYRPFFAEPRPVRTTVGSGLIGILVEIDVIAYAPPAGT